ncbi:uncharacterized protein [Euphorbia lathyris]|uniref:uncharacterized protein n=1 Tax=Euphorbia lathyris TaxID=212925 RepID=UPI0033138B07
MDTQKLLFCYFIFLLLFLFKISIANEYSCAPSSCGDIHNISYPFRLKTDPKACGVDTYELSCENNSTVLYFNDQLTKLNVKAINYDNYTIRVADPGIDGDDCSSLPRFGISTFEKVGYSISIMRRGMLLQDLTETISFIKCLNPVNSSRYLEIGSPCINGVVNSRMMYNYAFRGRVNAYDDLRENCSVEMTSMLPTRYLELDSMEKFVEIHRAMAFGFEVSWYLFYCGNLSCSMQCYLDTTQGNKLGCPTLDSQFGFRNLVLFSFQDFRKHIRAFFGKDYVNP